MHIKFLAQTDDFWVFEKPHGISTHSPSPLHPGALETLGELTGQKFYLCHRLDKSTSGVLLLPLSKEAAKRLTDLFSTRGIEKEYLFVTDRRAPFEVLDHESELTSHQGLSRSVPSKSPNSLTRFELLERGPKTTLWRAIPRTGKTHQIRAHAQELGIPILGDDLYGGSPYARLLLHAHRLQFLYLGKNYSFEAPLPSVFSSSLKKGELDLYAQLSAAMEQRTRALAFTPHECVRLSHTEASEVRFDKLGEVAWYYWYRDSSPTHEELAALQSIAQQAECSSWHIALMNNRGKDTDRSIKTSVYSQERPEIWHAEEEGVYYLFRSDQGRSPGLFLDQRLNRAYVRKRSSGKSVLNLFCYTAGFSVCAALGEAAQVVSVDTSKASLEWAKENFTLNGLTPDNFTFVNEDVRDFLARAKRRGQTYDIIILDPPSFARSKKKVFSFPKDFSALLEDCLRVLSKGGEMLVSSNYEKMKFARFIENIEKVVEGKGFRVVPQRPPLDFALHVNEPLTKCARVIRSLS